MRISTTLSRAVACAIPLAALGATLGAQTTRGERRDRDRGRDDDRGARVWTFGRVDDDRPRLGIITSSGGRRDTLGLLVTSVTPGSPADKAGIVEGDRIAAIDGVNLRLSRDDAEAGDMDGVLTNRLIRQLEKKKPGDDVELRLWSEGRTKTARVRTVDAEEIADLTRDRMRTRVDREERPVLGMSLGSTGSRRDTLGLMVMRVTPDGPAEKAGIVEGDRISAIDGADLRVSRDDLEEGDYGVRMSRLGRELRRLDVGKDVELRVVSGREMRTVRVRPVPASSLPRERRMGAFFYGDGLAAPMAMPAIPSIPAMPDIPAVPRVAPLPRVIEIDGLDRVGRDLEVLGRDGMRIHLSPRTRMEIEDTVRDTMDRVRTRIEPIVRGAMVRVII
jgi:hypothetical protein